MELNISIEGSQQADLVYALEQALKYVRNGYRQAKRDGVNWRMDLTVQGTPVHHYVVAREDGSEDVRDDAPRYTSLLEAWREAGPEDCVVCFDEDDREINRLYR